MISRRQSFRALAASVSSCFVASAYNRTYAADPQTAVRVGIMSGEDEDVWRVVASNARDVGLTIHTTSFSDYSLPDEALAEHELDANAFQHRPFLKAQNDSKGFDIRAVGETFLAPIGLYSRKWHTIADLPHGSLIGVPNDPSNEGRALRLLEASGILKLSAQAGVLATVMDITDNPRNVIIKELDAGVVGRALPDLDAAVVNTDWAKKSGIDIERERLAREAVANNPYVCVIAVNASDVTAPWVKLLVQSYQKPNVSKAILDLYHGAIVPAFG